MSTEKATPTADVLEQAVAAILNKALQAAETAGEFVVEQLPDVARQYVLYMGTWHTVRALAFLALLITIVVLYRRLVRWDMRDDAEHNDQGFITFVGGIVGGVATLLFVVWPLTTSVKTAIMAFLAPKVLLIQWAADLIK